LGHRAQFDGGRIPLSELANVRTLALFPLAGPRYRLTLPINDTSRIVGGVDFPVYSQLVVFGVDDMKAGRPAGSQQLFVSTDHGQPEGFEF
jgi:hypothetical protein